MEPEEDDAVLDYQQMDLRICGDLSKFIFIYIYIFFKF